MNIVYPMGLFALMSNMQFALPRYSTSDRFSLCFSLLLSRGRDRIDYSCRSQDHRQDTLAQRLVDALHARRR